VQSGNGTIEQLVEILSDPSFAQKVASGATSSSSAASGEPKESGEVPAGQVKSIVCSDCGKVFSDVSYAELHAEKTGHVNFAESDKAKTPLTAEEKAEQLRLLTERIAEQKRKRQEEEKVAEREREIARREGGKNALEVKRQLEEAKVRREMELRKKEKEDDAKAKARIKEQIEKDKEDRRLRAMGINPATHVGPVGAAASATQQQQPSGSAAAAGAGASSASKPAANYTECVIQVRLTNGQTIKESFRPEDTLAAVKRFIDEKRTDPRAPFTMMIPMPRTVFTDSDLGRSLKDLSLCPRAQITITLRA
jgi:hypothetical protein